MALLLGLFLVLLLAVRGLQVLVEPHPEIARKLFHTGGGLVALLFPFLFDRLWPVAALIAVSALTFLILRLVPRLHGSVGQVLGGVQRRSVGEFAFLAAVVTLFVLSGRAPVLFGAPLLILAVADASAALVGISYGSLHFRTVEGGRKSAEGSAAFFLAAFLCVHVPLLLWTDTGRAECLLIALNVAVVTMMAEAVAWYGLDNFLIPFFGLLFLRAYLRMDVAELALHFGLLLGLSLFVYSWRRRTTLSGNALFGAIVFGYIVWLLAGWRWLVPPVLLFATYRAASQRVELDRLRHIHFPALMAVLLPPLLWPVCHWLTAGPSRVSFLPFALCFAACFAADLAIIAVTRHKHVRPQVGAVRLVLVNAAKGLGIVLVPSALIFGVGPADALAAGLAALGVVLATAAFVWLQPQLDSYPLDADRWVRQAICVSLTSALPLVAW
jgi:phytol kinase